MCSPWLHRCRTDNLSGELLRPEHGSPPPGWNRRGKPTQRHLLSGFPRSPTVPSPSDRWGGRMRRNNLLGQMNPREDVGEMAPDTLEQHFRGWSPPHNSKTSSYTTTEAVGSECTLSDCASLFPWKCQSPFPSCGYCMFASISASNQR